MSGKLNSLKELLAGVEIKRQPAEPSQTPSPEKNKVVSQPARQPINRQAALIMRKAPDWARPPLPPEPERTVQLELRDLKILNANLRQKLEELHTENLGLVKRNKNVVDQLESKRKFIDKLKDDVNTLQAQVEALKQELSAKEEALQNAKRTTIVINQQSL